MRLIDADALHKDLLDSYELLKRMYDKAEDEQEIKNTTAILVCLVECTMRIKDAPTIDATPVVHARWKTSSDDPDRLICSACGRRYDMYHFDQKDMPYCFCGAKMDAKEDES